MTGWGACTFVAAMTALTAGPAFRPEAPNLDLTAPGLAPVVEFIGLDVVREGAEKPAAVPEFVVGIPSRMTLHWVPVDKAPESLAVVVALKGSGPRVRIERPVVPESWEIGVPARFEIDLDVPRFTHAGEGVLEIILQSPETGEAVLHRGPSYTHQIVTKSNFPESDIARLFGPKTHSLRAAFRLGEGARVPVAVKHAAQRPVAAVGVVSALHHSFRFTDGEPVVRLSLFNAAGQETAAVDLRAGIDTSLSEYDVPRPGTFALSQTPVAAERPHPGDRLTWNKRPLTLYTYYALMPLDQPVETARIEASFLGEKGVIDIYDIVLLYEDGA